MKYIEKNISQFIETQFPALFREEGPVLVQFVKSYFEWMESEDQILHKTRRLLEYRDIDRTLEDYIEYFKEKYAKDLDLTTEADKRLFIKNIQDLYKSKGSERSYEILFRTLFNKDIKIYYPGDDVLRVSDGQWYEGKYLEITSFVPNIESYVGKEIRGVKSGASALVENFSQRISNGKVIDVLEISNLRGSFDYGERIYVSSSVGVNLGRTLPNLTGSLSAIGVIDGGASFSVGDVLDVHGKGSKGKARVASTISQQGRVTFILENGGTGYSLNAISQVFPQIRLTANGAITGTISQDQLVFQTDGGGNMTANGIVMQSNSTTLVLRQSTGGFAKGENVKSALKLIMNPVSGNFTNGEFIYQSNGSANVATGYIVSIIPNTSNTGYYVANVTGTFVQSEYSISGNTLQVVGNTSSAQAFLYETYGGIATGSMKIANVVGGGTGASFRVGGIIDKEVVSINSDKISSYLNTRFMLFNEGSPATGTVTVTAGANTVTGSGTSFTTALTVGKYIQVGVGGSKQIRKVSTITDNLNLTTTETFTSSAAANNYYIDQINYMFPKVSSLLDVENLETVLTNALTFTELEIGTIQYLSGINPGTGYSLDPYTSVIEPLIASQEIISPNGYKGADAVVVGEAGSANGIVLGLSVIDSGLGYEEGEKLLLSKPDSPFSVTGSAILQQHGMQEGYWKTSKGFLSSDKFIQDSKYYQEYSYEVQTPLNFNNYKDVVKALLHTAGTEFFGKFALKNNDLDTPVSYEQSSFTNTDIVLANNYPTARPIVDFNFSERKTLDARFTYTRTGNATYVDSDGIIKTVTSNVPRFDHNPITGFCNGLLVEDSVTNYALYSQEIDNAYWSKFATSVTPNVGIAPDGTLTADLVVQDKFDGNGNFSRLFTSTPCDQTHTLSVFVNPFNFLKQNRSASFSMQFYEGNGVTYKGYIDYTFETGVFQSSGNNGATVSNIKAEQFPNGWYRLSCTLAPAGSAANNLQVRYIVSPGTANFDSNVGMLVWGIQVERNAALTSYVPTTTVSVARNRDSVIMNGVTSWFNQGQGTILMIYNQKSTPQANDRKARFTNSIDTTDFIEISQSGTNVVRGLTQENSVAQLIASVAGGDTNNFTNKFAFAYNTNDAQSALNGTLSTVDTTGTVPVGIDTLALGSALPATGGNEMNGCILRFVYYPQRLTSAQIQALTV